MQPSHLQQGLCRLQVMQRCAALLRCRMLLLLLLRLALLLLLQGTWQPPSAAARFLLQQAVLQGFLQCACPASSLSLSRCLSAAAGMQRLWTHHALAQAKALCVLRAAAAPAAAGPVLLLLVCYAWAP
jgi:hypothetical protein